jgi:hypothetical protein
MGIISAALGALALLVISLLGLRSQTTATSNLERLELADPAQDHTGLEEDGDEWGDPAFVDSES